MSEGVTIVAGIPIPSHSPLFLAGVGLHVAAGLVCVVAGAVAMLSPKTAARHPRFGTLYFRALTLVFVSSSALALVRWREDYPLFILGGLAFLSALIGRESRRRLWPGWPRLHIAGMGASYVLLLTAFYVDNGKNLPGWKELPPISYWLLPAGIGAPLILHALLRHPLVRRRSGSLDQD